METPLERVYREYAHVLYRFAVGLTGDIDEANDIIQNVFTRLAAQQHLDHVSLTRSYLFSAVKNGAKDLWKRKKPVPFSQVTSQDNAEENADAEIPDDTTGLLENADVAFEIAFVLKAITLLTEEQREIISLKYFSGFSNKEVAAEIGKNENTVRQMEFRALRSLRRILRSEKNKYT